MLLTHQSTHRAVTSRAPDFIDVTDEVQAVLENSGIADGQITVFTPEESCALLVNEYETGLVADLERVLLDVRKRWPSAAIGSRSVVLPALDRRVQLGTWQRLILVELEAPAERSIVVHVMGEG